MITILSILAFILGIVIGSFLNVVIYRWNTDRTLKGRSACLSCQNKLCWYELIPLLSFFALGGRCRFCQSKISRMYPAVEFLTGVIFLGLFLKFQDFFFFDLSAFAFIYLFYGVLFSIMIVIAFYDLKHKIIPDQLSMLAGVISFFGLFVLNEYEFGLHMPTWSQFLAGPAISLPFALLWFVSRGTWMGLGDAKLVLSLGWLAGLSRALSGMIVAFWSGAILGVIMILFSKQFNMKSEIPFAPFLIFGTIISFLLELHVFPVF